MSGVESSGELGWFRGEVVRAVLRPREFARALTLEHFGLAGVLVALGAGMALSLTIDLFVLAWKGIPPSAVLGRLLADAFFLAVRLDVSAALVAFGAHLVLRATRRTDVTLDQIFTAVTFALAPLLVAPIAALVVVVAPEALAVAGAFVLVVVVRALAGLAMNLAAILPLPLVALALALILGGGDLVLGDQISRSRFTAYAIAPDLAPALVAAPAEGKRYDLDGFSLTLPAEWTVATRGVRGEAARFETATETLVVDRATGAPLATADSYADQILRGEQRGYENVRSERAIVRVNGSVVVDDRTIASIGGRPVALRQFTAVSGTRGLALAFRFIDAPDASASFERAASIAATWQLAPGR
jgi:hypothetical protein